MPPRRTVTDQPPARFQPAPTPAAPSRGSITVGCKLDIPYFELQLCREQEVSENTQTGPRLIKQFFKTGKIVTIRGTAYPSGTPPLGFPEKPEMRNGYAITHGVDADFFEEWMSQNALAPYVLSGMVCGFERIDDLIGFTEERKDVLSGLQPVLPDKDKRLPRSMRPEVTKPETEDSRRSSIQRTMAQQG